MTGVMEHIFQMPSGRYKACFWGHDNFHVSDWRGCNFRRVVIKGQPRKGFETAEEARDWVLSLDDKTYALEHRRAREINGTFLSDDDGWVHAHKVNFKREPIEVSSNEFYEYMEGFRK